MVTSKNIEALRNELQTRLEALEDYQHHEAHEIRIKLIGLSESARHNEAITAAAEANRDAERARLDALKREPAAWERVAGAFERIAAVVEQAGRKG